MALSRGPRVWRVHGNERAQARQFREVWRLLLLSLAVAWVVSTTACGSAGSSVPAGGAGENRYLSPTPIDTGLQDEEIVLRETSLYYDDTPRMDLLHYSEQARRMDLLGNWREAISSYSRAIAVDPSDGAAYEGRGKGPLYAR